MNQVMDKPTVFFVGTKKKNAPSEPQLTKEKMEQIRRNVEQYLRKK